MGRCNTNNKKRKYTASKRNTSSKKYKNCDLYKETEGGKNGKYPPPTFIWKNKCSNMRKS